MNFIEVTVTDRNNIVETHMINLDSVESIHTVSGKEQYTGAPFEKTVIQFGQNSSFDCDFCWYSEIKRSLLKGISNIK